MSKFSDRLKDGARDQARPMGFAAAVQTPPRPALLLLARAQTAAAIKAALAAGAEGVLAPAGAALKPLKDGVKEGMWGVILETGGKAEIEQLEEAGGHMVLLQSTTIQADAFQADQADKLLAVDSAMADISLRAIERLPIAATVISLASGAFTIESLLDVHRLLGLTQKPALAALPKDADPSVLAVLRDAGVRGVLVNSAQVQAFVQGIKDLPPPKKSHDRMEAVLPQPSGGASRHEEDEEEGRASRASAVG